MVHRTRYGLGENPVHKFEALRPYVTELRKMQESCKPFGRDYMAIAIAIDALETTAFHFTRRPHFYGCSS